MTVVTEPPASTTDEPTHANTADHVEMNAGHVIIDDTYKYYSGGPRSANAAQPAHTQGEMYPTIQGVAAMSASAGTAPTADANVHQVVTDGDGKESYVQAPGPEPVQAHRHWFDRDSQGVLHYVSNAVRATTDAVPAPEPSSAHHIMTDPNGGADYYMKESLTDAQPSQTETASAPQATGHHCLPDDSGGTWYTGDQATFNVPPLGADTARVRKVGSFQGRDLYRENLDAAATTDPALAPTQRHKCVTLPGSDLPIYVGDGEDDYTPIVPETTAYVQPVTLEATDDEQARAAVFTSSLWEYIRRAGGPHPDHQRTAIYRRVFRPEYLAELALPTRDEIPEGQTVTLSFSTAARYTDRAELIEAYNAQPRTWVFERTHHTVAWLNLAAAYLGRLSGSKLEVLAAVFDSYPRDETPGAQTDEWYSVIVQTGGAKTWTINPGAAQQQYTTRAGDVLLIPEGVVHATATPDEPGHSRHIQFTLCRHTIYTTAPAPSGPVALAMAS